MRRTASRPRRSIRSEALSLGAILSLPLALVIAFPFSAVGYRDAGPTPRPVVAPFAFVELADGGEARAMDVVRAAFSVRPDRVRDLRADLSLATLPEEGPDAIVDFSDRRLMTAPSPLAFDAVPFPPSLAADEPVEISPAERSLQAPAFSREELLSLGEEPPVPTCL